ncbi:MAG: hypothetical protein KGL67_02090 [Patescibacteria group bacterium]|nr:hypothetical protein [Patescibacteria group bacterium]
MRRERILLILGVWVALLPYLGFPYSWKNVLFTLSGLIVIYYSYMLNKEYKATQVTKPFDNFRENSDFHTSESAPQEVVGQSEEKI